MGLPVVQWRALYYPYLQIADPVWIKTAALYYDHIDRIVPAGVIPRDNRTVKSLNNHFDFVHSIDPGKAAQDIIPDFLRFVLQHLKLEADRKEIVEKLENKFDFNKGFSILTGKVGNQLVTELTRLGFKVSPSSDSRSYEFDAVTGPLYIAFLANRLAASRQTAVVTDDFLFKPLIRHIQGQDSGEQGLTLATVIINCAIPEPLEEIPIRKIIAFRKRHDSERMRFYTEIGRLVAQLEEITDPDAIREIREHQLEVVKKSVSELRKSFLGVGISTSSGLLSLSAPSVVAHAGAMAATGGVLAMAGARSFSAYADKQKAKAGSPLAYVLSLKKLRSSSLIEDLLKGKIIL